MGYLEQYDFTPEQQHVIDRLNDEQRFKLRNIAASFDIEDMHLTAANIVDGARILLGEATADTLAGPGGRA